jgi:hypothetical protein
VTLSLTAPLLAEPEPLPLARALARLAEPAAALTARGVLLLALPALVAVAVAPVAIDGAAVADREVRFFPLR